MRNDGTGISWSDLITPDDSLQRLFDMISQVEREYQRLSTSVINSSTQMQNAIQNLGNAQNQALNVVGLTRQAQDVKAVMQELQNMVKSLSQAKAASSNLTADMLGNANSIETLTRALRDNIKAFQDLSVNEKLSATNMQNGVSVNNEYLDRITSLRTQINLTNRALKAYSTELRAVEEGGRRYTTTMLKMNDEEKRMLQQVKEREEASKRAVKMEELTAKINAAKKGSYEQLSARYQRNIMLLKQMSDVEYKAASARGGLVEQTRSLQIRLREMDEAVGNYTRNVGHYQKVWSGFDFSVAQLVREMPNMAMGARTFFMALSNNWATLADEIKVFRMEQAQLRAEGKPTMSVWKRLGQSLASFNTILMVGVTFLTAYGEAWWKAFKDWATGRNELNATAKAMDAVAEAAKKTNNNFGDLQYSFYKLKREWSELKTDAEKQSWIDMNRDAFDKLGLSIYNLIDADRAFVEMSDKVVASLKQRAMAAAAEQAVKDKAGKILEIRTKTDAMKAKALSKQASKSDYFTTGSTAQIYAKYSRLSPEAKKEASLAFGLNNITKLDLEKSSTAALSRLDDYLDALLEEKQIKQLEKEMDDLYKVADNYNRKAAKNISDVSGDLESRLGIRTDEAGHKYYMSDGNRVELSRELKDWEMRQLLKLRATARTNQELQITNLDASQFPEAKFIFSKYKKKSEGAGRKGPEGIDFDAWYLRESENLRHKDALADAKSEENAWNRQIELIDEKYEHERQKMTQLWEYALDIQSGKVKVKGEMTDERKAKLSEFIGSFPGYMQEIEDANVRERFDVYNKIKLKRAEHEKAIIDLRLKGVVENSEAERELLKERLDKERELALLRNRLLPEQERQDPADIAKAFDLQEKKMYQSFNVADVKRDESQFKTRFDMETLRRRNADPMFGFNSRQQQIRGYEKELHDLNTQRLLLIDEMESGLADSQRMSEILDELALLDEKSVAAEKAADELQGVKGLLGSISQEGLLGGILNMTGMKDDTRKAVVSSFDIIKDNISSLIDSYVQLAEAAVKAQEQQVSAAQKVVDAELEASKQGYANRVVSAQEELKLEKQKLKEQKKERERALKIQRAMDTAEAASSLTVAIAQLWKSCIGTSGPFGVPMATALTAVMLGSFVASKVKAAKASRMQDEEYGEGGLEFLEGGSHASGNDIDLHTRNSEGKNMRAEGGEAMAIINKRNTRKYKGILPDVIDSLNKGVFEDKYLNAFSQGAQLHAQILAMPTFQQTDLSGLESKLDKLVKQGENKVVSLPNGNTIEYFGNVKRTIKKND